MNKISFISFFKLKFNIFKKQFIKAKIVNKSKILLKVFSYVVLILMVLPVIIFIIFYTGRLYERNLTKTNVERTEVEINNSEFENSNVIDLRVKGVN